MPTKICKKCSTEKDLSEFYVKSNTTYCKICTQSVNNDWISRNKERVREYRNKWRRETRKRNPDNKWLTYELSAACKKFGTTKEWYYKQSFDQNNLCAICGKEETAKHQNGKVVRLSIDHNHTTGKVRGLLCRLCNHALHNLDKDINWAYKAVEYLNRTKETQNVR